MIERLLNTHSSKITDEYKLLADVVEQRINLISNGIVMLNVFHMGDPYGRTYGMLSDTKGGTNTRIVKKASSPKGLAEAFNVYIAVYVIRDGFLYHVQIDVPYRAPEYVIEDYVRVYQPHVVEIIEEVHKKYYGTLYTDDYKSCY